MMEPVTISDAPRADAFHFEVNDIIAKERDYALERANPTEALGGLACRAPAHGFGPGESADDGRNDIRNHFGRRAARLFNDGEEDAVALVVLTFNELIASQASGAQEAFKRLSRRVRPWTFPLLSDRFSLKGQTFHDKGQPTRRHIAGKACRLDRKSTRLNSSH